MSKRLAVVFLLLLSLVALPVFAEDAAQASPASGGSNVKWGALAAAFTIAVAAAAGAVSQGKAVVAACDAMGRNPGSAGAVRMMALIGLAFIESLVIYALVIAWTVKG